MTEKEYLKRDAIETKENTWCKLSSKGEVEYIDWVFVENQANQFDVVGDTGVRDQIMVMCKLMSVARKQTLERASTLLQRFAATTNDAPAVIVYDPVNDGSP